MNIHIGKNRDLTEKTMSQNLYVVSTWTAATVWSLWSRSKWWALQLFPPSPSLLFIPQNKKMHTQKIWQLYFFKLLPWVQYVTSPFDPAGGRCELSAAGDLWHWEQIQQPGIKGDKIKEASCLLLLCICFSHNKQSPRLVLTLWSRCRLQVADDEISDNSAECVVCLSDVRDTLILPCRHLCLCNACADTLRYQANCCPICRLREFKTLWLQIDQLKNKWISDWMTKNEQTNKPVNEISDKWLF